MFWNGFWEIWHQISLKFNPKNVSGPFLSAIICRNTYSAQSFPFIACTFDVLFTSAPNVENILEYYLSLFHFILFVCLFVWLTKYFSRNDCIIIKDGLSCLDTQIQLPRRRTVYLNGLFNLSTAHHRDFYIIENMILWYLHHEYWDLW